MPDCYVLFNFSPHLSPHIGQPLYAFRNWIFFLTFPFCFNFDPCIIPIPRKHGKRWAHWWSHCFCFNAFLICSQKSPWEPLTSWFFNVFNFVFFRDRWTNGKKSSQTLSISPVISSDAMLNFFQDNSRLFWWGLLILGVKEYWLWSSERGEKWKCQWFYEATKRGMMTALILTSGIYKELLWNKK